VIALSVAAVLAVFLLYTAVAGGSTPSLQPSDLRGRSERVGLSGKVVTPVQRGERTVRFRLRDVEGSTSVPVRYSGTIPDLFRAGRDVHVEGKLQDGVFVADRLTTKCPSKYAPKQAA
jgi:cytochrome c-type biogenesis protein CcmE